MRQLTINGRSYPEGFPGFCHTSAMLAAWDCGGALVAGWLWQEWDGGYTGVPHFWCVDPEGAWRAFR